MRNRNRKGRRHQQNGVDQWQTPGADNAFRCRVGVGVRIVDQRPCRLETFPEDIGTATVAFTAKPGHREHPGVEQGTEESREEHDLGKNEPAHTPAEGTIHLWAVQA